MFALFKKLSLKKKSHPEALLAADWWASRLLDDKVKFYNGNICFIKMKNSVPETEKVALFEEGIRAIVDSYIETTGGFIDLKLSSSDQRLISLAREADIDDFESHFGNGAVMYVSSYDGVNVLYVGQERSRKL